jgi:thiamine-monophosphate kinase
MEAEFIRHLRAHVSPHPSLKLGIGDDAGIVSLAGRTDVVVTTDLLSDGVDFDLAAVSPRVVGRKALAVNLSDLAAMAARPVAAVVAIAMPNANDQSELPLDLAKLIYEGLLSLAAEFDVALAGGDTNSHDGPLVISITALGTLSDRGPLRRSGGRPGDQILVTGTLGGSILGHHFNFTPRVREALLLHEKYELHAGIDISDGLALDLSRLATEGGCGAVIHTDRLPISTAADNLAGLESNTHVAEAALRHALSDGEDFELLLAAPPQVADSILRDQPLDCKITCIGELVAEPGLWQQSKGTERRPLEPTGWQH